MWYFYALLGPAIWALLNHLDKYLLGRFFNQNAAGPVLVVFTGFAGLILAIAIVSFGPPVLALAPGQASLLMFAGTLLVASYIPYMIALQRDEASIVASLYRLLPLFVFALSYVILGETLQLRQIGGGAITIAGSILLIVDLDKTRRGFNLRTFFLMWGRAS
jgi:drug/metabolite transporter (DMT)-like permease